MLKIHLDGKGVCGVFSRDVAATWVNETLGDCAASEQWVHHAMAAGQTC
jgi:ATP-dependent Clp protease adapter protein ClpS